MKTAYTFLTGETATPEEMETYERIKHLLRLEDAACELEQYVDFNPDCFDYCVGRLNDDMAQAVWSKVFKDKYVLEHIVKYFEDLDPANGEKTNWQYAIEANEVDIETAIKEHRQAYRDERNERLLDLRPYPFECKICVYADNTNLFGQDEIDDDNLVDIVVSEDILRQWFEEHVRSGPDDDFVTWFEEESTADETDGFFEYCLGHGIEPLIETWRTEPSLH